MRCENIFKFYFRKRGQSSAAAEAAAVELATSASEIADDSGAMEADPDEQRYCICNEVAYGDMVACDGKNVRDTFPSELHLCCCVTF